MATHHEIAARHSYARSLMERRIRVTSAVTMISTKFSVSRSTAYEDCRTASEELAASDDGPADEEETVCAETLQAQLIHSLDKAFATDQYKEIPKLIKALDEVKRWSGYETSMQNPYS